MVLSMRAATGLSVLLSALAGLTLPPVGACMRALWPQLLPSAGLLTRAYGLEATIQELAFAAGPPLVAAIATVASPRMALIVSAGCGSVGAIAFGTRNTARSSSRRPSGAVRPAVLQAIGIRTILTTQCIVGISFGAVEVSMPAFAERHGARATSGLLLCALAIGSVIGGVWMGTRADSREAVYTYLRALGALVVVFMPPLLASSVVAMAPLMLLAGLPIAPSFAAAYVLFDRLAVPGGATETFAWGTACLIAGVSIGTGLGGAAIQSLGYRASLSLGVVFALLAAALAFSRRTGLRAEAVLTAETSAR